MSFSLTLRGYARGFSIHSHVIPGCGAGIGGLIALRSASVSALAAGVVPYLAGVVPYLAGVVPYLAGVVPYLAGVVPCRLAGRWPGLSLRLGFRPG